MATFHPRGKSMAQATTISLAKFTASVQAAVKAAVANHPKFQIAQPTAISVSYLIRGFPVPEAIISEVTMTEIQAYAATVAESLGTAHPEIVALRAGATQGAVLSVGHHVIVGIPPVSETFNLEK
jgi:hypothetical protein